MRARIAGLTLVYLLATLLAQGMHDHGDVPREIDSHHGAGCDDPRQHVSGHPSTPSHELSPDCLACHYSSQSQLWQPPSPGESESSSPAPREPAPPLLLLITSRLPSCRAPPTV